MSEKKPSISFKTGAMILSSALLCSNAALGLVNASIPGETIYPIATALVVEGIFLDQIFFRTRKYEELFRLCGLENKDKKVPIVIKEQKKDRKTTLVIRLPEGISQKHFEKVKEELEQFLNAKIEFGFNKNLIMEMIDMNLKTNYPYTFEKCDKPLQVYCGETYEGKFYLDIEKCPHIIVAGETDSGKTSLLDNITLSLILSPHKVDLHLIDFQAVGLGIFERCKKVKSYGETMKDFEELLDELEKEAERRLKLFRSVKNRVYIEKLSTWNECFPERALPYKVIIIDEFARLADKENEYLLEKFRRRVAMDRKVGFHYIASIQRPDVTIIQGSIKANMPTRIAFKVVTSVDSEVILDQKGAEKIKNQGRFLIKYCGEIKEVQALYVQPKKIDGILKQYNKYKTEEELKAERKAKIKKLRENCINPYLKGRGIG